MAVTKKPAKKSDRDRSGALYVILDPEMIQRLDDWAAKLNEKNQGPQWTRTAVVRSVLMRALEERAEKGEVP